MKNYILENEYITNKEQVIEVLEGKKFYIEYLGQDKMNDFDTYNMYHYILTIEGQKFDYFEGIGNDLLDNDNINDKIINGLYCLLSDSLAYNNTNDLEDFMLEYGYEDKKVAQKIYNGCVKIDNKLQKIFTSEELNTLKENINL